MERTASSATIPLSGDEATAAPAATAGIPASHRDLIDGPYWAALTTVMPDGRPQTTPVWCNRQGVYVLTNTMQGFRKEQNMRTNPRVSLLVYDPRNPLRNIEVRGRVVEMTAAGALAHDDELAALYLRKPGARFFGDAVPAALAATHHPIKVTIAPIHVRVEDPAPSISLRRAPATGLDDPPGPAPAAAPNAAPAPLPGMIPDSHRDLLARPVYGVLATMMPDGQPQSSLVWVDYDGAHVLINTTMERQKCRNMRANPKVALLVVDPANAERWIEVRGQVAHITRAGAIAHADKLTQRYTGKPHFYGDVYEAERERQETRVIVEITPVKVARDAIFSSAPATRPGN
jgi:PPOX class probable F420-dependent enzyme